MSNTEHNKEVKTKPQDGEKSFASLKMHMFQIIYLKLLFLSFRYIFLCVISGTVSRRSQPQVHSLISFGQSTSL